MNFVQLLIGRTVFDSMWAIIIMSPISLPIILSVVAFHVFRHRTLVARIYKEGNVLLEIKLPREQLKSPRAMEIALSGFWVSSQGNWYSKFFKGRHRRWFSLELVSLEGSIHFVIRTNVLYQNLIEGHLYSQYPDIEIREVDDYTLDIDFLEHHEKWKGFGIELKPDKASCYPFKTYVDFELDRDPKEELKNDPLLGIIEAMGSMGPGEYMLSQLLILPTLHEGELKKIASDEVKKIVKKTKKVEGLDFVKSIIDTPTPGERIIAESIEKKLMKPLFDVGLRHMYIAKRESYRSSMQYSILNPYRVFNNPQGNAFTVGVETDYDAPISFHGGIYPKIYRIDKMTRQMFDAYRKRSYFFPPYTRTVFQLNVEELATMYHFPGRVSETPTLARIESKRGEAPVNLPV